MQEVRVVTFCDYPECAADYKNFNPESEVALGQATTTVEYWVYASGRGRKTQPIKIELCDAHKEMLREVYTHAQRYDQNKEH